MNDLCVCLVGKETNQVQKHEMMCEYSLKISSTTAKFFSKLNIN